MTEWMTLAAAGTGLALLPKAVRRLQLSVAKHPSLTGHSKMALRLARWLPGYRLEGDAFYGADGASLALQSRRREGLQRLAHKLNTRHARSLAATREAREGLSDLQLTGAYRVPFPFSATLRGLLGVGAFVQRVDGAWVVDLDGERLLDLTGSYGVNVLGHAFYQRSMAEAQRRALPYGVGLGTYPEAMLDVVQRLRRLSGQDEVSFHMSGTEAVMQAVRLARYHTGRRKLVRFCGAYHGWWGDVQPGPGNPMPAQDTYTLRDLDERSLRVLRTRRDIACVLVNPLQVLHPNKAAPGDSGLMGARTLPAVDAEAYRAWLEQLRAVCSERGIALIFDEVFMGFRLAPGGAQERFGVQADLVTYGKTLGGGFPLGVLCGQARWMKRYRDDRPADLCFARGTFNAHPHVVMGIQVFLEQLDTPEVQALYAGQESRWDARAARLNRILEDGGWPVRVSHWSSVWSVAYTQPGRYHWLLQFYLREQGLALSWVGTGRMVFTLDFSATDFDTLCHRFAAACAQMQADGWWDEAPAAPALRRRLIQETWAAWRRR
ncbi:MAG: aminotransferase class III-fold pyridoxal phosphate-dependent enzyme [Inhella sp.]|uniref:aminotransferase class III-fold pyridoxal phosphate-dependent enzyme n=1 Tax=Inhella sp. TaxID=1921806 RepID=UPI00391F14BC